MSDPCVHLVALSLQGHLTAHQKQALQEMKDVFPNSRRWHNDHDLLRWLCWDSHKNPYRLKQSVQIHRVRVQDSV